MQLPLYGLVSQRRRRAWIQRGQRPMATIEQYWARGSFSRQIHLHPPPQIHLTALTSPNPNPSAPQSGHHFPNPLIHMHLAPSSSPIWYARDVQATCSKEEGIPTLCGGGGGSSGAGRSPHPRSRWLIDDDSFLPQPWWQLCTDGPESRTWRWVSSGSSPPNQRRCRHGRGDGAILH